MASGGPAWPVWTTRSVPARIQRGGASRYGPVGGALQKMHTHEQPLFREPVGVPVVLRVAASLTEAPPGRIDAGKGSRGLKSLLLGLPLDLFDRPPGGSPI